MLNPRKLANIQVLIMLSLRLVLRVETDEEPGYEWTILTALGRIEFTSVFRIKLPSIAPSQQMKK